MFFDDEPMGGQPADGGMANDGSMPTDDGMGDDTKEEGDGGAM